MRKKFRKKQKKQIKSGSSQKNLQTDDRKRVKTSQLSYNLSYKLTNLSYVNLVISGIT